LGTRHRLIIWKGDLMLYVVGGAEENEILLYHVILALRDSLNILLKYGPTFPHLPTTVPLSSHLAQVQSLTTPPGTPSTSAR
jgi:hypothetical protein